MANPNFDLATSDEATAFFQALETDDVETLRALIQQNPKILRWERGDGKTPLRLAAGGPNLKVAEFLLSIGYGVNAHPPSSDRDTEYTPLHEAAYTGGLEMATFLVERGANVNAGSGRHDTPLHRTAWRNQHAVARFLLERGADPNIHDHEGRSPLALSIRQKSREVEEILRGAGADLAGVPIKVKKVRPRRTIDLPKYVKRIERLIVKAVNRYAREHSDQPLAALALHASGVHGFVSVCLEPEHFGGDVPSMKYFSYETIQVSHWSDAYEAYESVWVKTVNGDQIELDTTAGDEQFERPFFNFLLAALQRMAREKQFDKLPRKPGFQIGIEFLEGDYAEFWAYA